MNDQKQMYYDSVRRLSDADLVMMELLFGVNPITDDELRKSIEKRPHIYKRYEGFLGRRANGVLMPCCAVPHTADEIYEIWSNPFPGSNAR